MATTTNFGWETPDDTDLVKDGAAAIRTLGNSIDTSLVDLKGGTTGQILSKNSNTDMDFTWIANDQGDITAVTAGTGITGGGTSGAVTITNAMATEITAKGDLIVGTGSATFDNLPAGANGTILSADSGQTTGLKWITNPVKSYTQRIAPLGAAATYAVNYIASDGTNFVAVGDNGYLYESSDGITWTSRTSGFGSNDIDCVAFGNGLWVAVGQNGTIATSTDRVTWTTRTSNMSTNQINFVAYVNSNWVAVGAGGGTTNTGGVTYSSDGITWTRVNQSLTVGPTYNTVIWNGTNYIVGANNSTNNYIYSATLAGTWTAGSAAAVTIEALFYDGTRTIVASSTNLRYGTSTDLSSLTTVQNFSIESGDGHRDLYLYSGRLYYQKSFITSVSTTPAVAGYLNDIATAHIAPGTQPNTTGALSADNNVIFAGSQGLIVGGQFGQLYTNF